MLPGIYALPKSATPPPPPAPPKKTAALAKPKSATPGKPPVVENKVLPNKSAAEAIEERSKVGAKALGDLSHLQNKGKVDPSATKPISGKPATHTAAPLEGKAGVKITPAKPTGPGSLDAAMAETGTKKLTIEIDEKKSDAGYSIKTDQLEKAPQVLKDRFKGLTKIEKGDKTYFVKPAYADAYKKMLNVK